MSWSGHPFTRRSCSETQNAKNELKMFDILRIITQNNEGQEAEKLFAPWQENRILLF